MSQWIAGQWVDGLGDEMASLNPFTDEVIWQGRSATSEQVSQAVKAARAALLQWRHTSLVERQAILEKFAELVKANSENIAITIAEETGKPLWETRTEAGAMVGKVAISLRAYHERTGQREKDIAGTTAVVRHRGGNRGRG